MKGLWNYLKDLETTHRTTRERLIREGKTYRSHKVSFENGYLNALSDILTIIENPEREQKLQEAMTRLIKGDKI